MNPTQTEAHKYLDLVRPYLKGCGVDIGSQGLPVIPEAMGIDLPEPLFTKYNGGNPPRGPIPIRCDGTKNLPFTDNSLDYVFSSHVLEDFQYWGPVLKEWARVIKPGGYLVILIPDKQLWQEALNRGQLPNPAHKHEGYAGELSTYAENLGLHVVVDELTNWFPGDYSMLFVGRKQ